MFKKASIHKYSMTNCYTAHSKLRHPTLVMVGQDFERRQGATNEELREAAKILRRFAASDALDIILEGRMQ